MNLYLIPFCTTRKGMSMEYRLVYRKRDMRLKFCKDNDKNIINPIGLITLIRQLNLLIKDDRIIMPNGKTAYEFNKLMKRGF